MANIRKFQTMNWKLYSQISNQVAQKGFKGSCFTMSFTAFRLNDGWCVRVSPTKLNAHYKCNTCVHKKGSTTMSRTCCIGNKI